MILGGLLLIGGIILALVTKSVKPIYIIAIASSVGALIIITGAIATLFKELNSSEKQESIRATGINTNTEVVRLRDQNEQLKSKSDSLLHKSSLQDSKLETQGNLLIDQGKLLVKQEEFMVKLRQENLDNIAKEELAKKAQLDIDMMKLKNAISGFILLWSRKGPEAHGYGSVEESKKWTDEALAIMKPELTNTILNQDQQVIEQWNNAVNALSQQSAFLVDPKFYKTRSKVPSNTFDPETSKKFLIESLKLTADKAQRAVMYAREKLIEQNPTR